jgi:hypothetical protein
LKIIPFLIFFLEIFKNPVTSTFGESRETRFHLGIDFSTFRKNGVPIFFPFELEVIGLKINFSGYGKVLYLKDKNGYIYVLAHLDRFNDMIDSIAFEKLLEREENEIEIFFENGIKIGENETIAFVGNTGCSYPHLHLEIRKNMEVALNPLKFIEINDTIPPFIEKVLLIPLGKSIINSSYFPLIIKKGIERVYGLGEFWVWVKGYDKWENGNKSGFYSIKIFKDDTLIFTKKIDSILVSKQREGNYFYFKKGKYYSSSYFHPFEFSLNINKDSKIKILIEDYKGNKDSIFFEIKNEIKKDFLRKIVIPSVFYSFDGIAFREGKNFSKIYAILNNEKIEIEGIDYGFYKEFKWIPPKFFEGKVKFLFDGKNNEKEIFVFFSENKLKTKNINGFEINYKSPFPFFFYAEIKDNEINIFPDFAIFDTLLINKNLKEKEYFVYNGKKLGKNAFSFKGGKFEIKIDTIPPFFNGNKIIYSKEIVNPKFYIYDKESGIDEKSIKFYIDGKFYPVYYHPIYGRLTLFKKIKLQKGEHNFSIYANDKAGNSLKIEGKIIVRD